MVRTATKHVVIEACDAVRAGCGGNARQDSFIHMSFG